MLSKLKGLLRGSRLSSSLPTHQLQILQHQCGLKGVTLQHLSGRPAQRWAAEVTWQKLTVNTGYQLIYKVSQVGQVNLFYSSLDFSESYYPFI